MDVQKIIDRLGGRAQLAADLGIPLRTVNAWYYRKSIPAASWGAIVKLARLKSKPISLDRIYSVHYGETV